MRNKTIPRLLYSGLGRRVYVVTRYTLGRTLTDPNRVVLHAQIKHDVTDDFLRAIGEWRRDGNTIDQLGTRKRLAK